VAFSLALPPTDWVPFAWLGLAALAFLLDDGEGGGRTRAGAARGMAFGFGVNLAGLRFVPEVIGRFTPLPFAAGVLALVLLALAQGLPWGAAGIARAMLVHARVPRPLAFAISIYIATFVPSIFPWTPAGMVGRWPVILQLGDLIGERGLSLLIALPAGLLARGARIGIVRETRRPALGVVALSLAFPLAMVLHGVVRMRVIDARRQAAPNLAVGLIDPAIPATTRWEAEAAPGILAALTQLTRGAERRGALLSVWPESAYPHVLPRGTKAGPPGNERLLQPGVRGPLLVGAVTRDGRGDQYNAALAVRSDGSITSEYDKVHLLWFGEEVPLASELPWIRRTFARGLGMLPGEEPVILDAGRVKAGVLICFEDLLPAAGREAALLSPNLLVNLSNDAWFAGSAESEIHLRFSVLRAVEARRDLVRAVNLGPTSWVDAAGRVRARYDAPLPGSLVIDAALLDDGPTFYARFGDWPWLLASAAMAFASTKRNERRTT
jgi:apolipoprotein N-acyltransferase